MLRDPSGRSLHKHLPERVSGHCWHFPSEQGDSTTLPATSEWITGRHDIAALAPFLERQMIYSHWERYRRSTLSVYLRFSYMSHISIPRIESANDVLTP